MRLERLESRELLATIGNNIGVGTELRNYRVAIAATAEYTTHFGGAVVDASQAIDAYLVELNAFLEAEWAVHLDLIPNNDLLIYTDAGTDPYTNGVPGTMIGENQTNVDLVIGNANYDIGHVFGTIGSGGSGLAGLGVVGLTNQKARGVSTFSSPEGLGWLKLSAHEFGHQFDASHTFNANAFNSCLGNRSGSSAYEPASGTTLMSYAGICGADDLQNDPELYFHSASFESVQELINSSATPDSTTATGNSVPVVGGGNDFTIPAGTPFELTTTATDADGDTLTYTWGQLDLGPAQSLPITDIGMGPLFTSNLPQASNVRSFPTLSDVLANTTSDGETLPSTTRTINFRASARDGNAGVNSDDVALSVVATGTPFAITSQNGATTWTGGSAETITWDVAGTDTNGIDTADVRILISTDGGQTFPFDLGTTTNDGSHSITVPNIDSTEVRLRVQGEGNIFYDINNVDITINSDAGVAGVSLTETGGDTTVLEVTGTDTYDIALNTDPAGDVTLQIQADAQTEVSLDGINFAATQSVVLNSTTAQAVTVRAINDGLLEGPHMSTLSHSVTASTSVGYPMGTAINQLIVNVLDDESPAVVGLDFDFVGSGFAEAPTN
jgi:hypothetical protein